MQQTKYTTSSSTNPEPPNRCLPTSRRPKKKIKILGLKRSKHPTCFPQNPETTINEAKTRESSARKNSNRRRSQRAKCNPEKAQPPPKSPETLEKWCPELITENTRNGAIGLREAAASSRYRLAAVGRSSSRYFAITRYTGKLSVPPNRRSLSRCWSLCEIRASVRGRGCGRALSPTEPYVLVLPLSLSRSLSLRFPSAVSLSHTNTIHPRGRLGRMDCTHYTQTERRASAPTRVSSSPCMYVCT